MRIRVETVPWPDPRLPSDLLACLIIPAPQRLRCPFRVSIIHDRLGHGILAGAGPANLAGCCPHQLSLIAGPFARDCSQYVGQIILSNQQMNIISQNDERWQQHNVWSS